MQATRQIAEAMPRLRGFKDVSHYTVEINRLENDGDRLQREALASLFDDGIDPMVVIRWKDIYERLEEAIDATEKVANILEGIVIKNARPMSSDVVLVIVVVTALAFDFTNGFHDTANVVATSISTRAMSPRLAVAFAVAAQLRRRVHLAQGRGHRRQRHRRGRCDHARRSCSPG